jgi:hypothetical protein
MQRRTQNIGVETVLNPDSSMRLIIDAREVVTFKNNDELIEFGRLCVEMGEARRDVMRADLDRH